MDINERLEYLYERYQRLLSKGMKASARSVQMEIMELELIRA